MNTHSYTRKAKALEDTILHDLDDIEVMVGNIRADLADWVEYADTLIDELIDQNVDLEHLCLELNGTICDIRMELEATHE